MSRFCWSLLLCIFFLASGAGSLRAQEPQPLVAAAAEKKKLAILLPLYLDSAFDAAGQYRFGKTFPRYFLPGLEFYEGVQLAVDTLRKEGVPVEIHVIDTRSTKSIYEILQLPAVQSANLLLAQIANNEIRPLADFANKNQVPFINVNLPNDGGITNNPYMVILNSTLATHCEGIYKYLQKNYSTGTVVVFRKAGAQEDRLRNYLTETAKSSMGPAVKLKWVTLPSGFTAGQLTPYLDSSKATLCLAGSLDENFARTVCLQLAGLNKTYPVKVMGMPTWDGIRELDKKEYQGLEIFYSTPFNPMRTDSLSESVNTYFRDKLYARPSDMVFRGYETTYRYAKLLRDLGSNIASGLGEKKYMLFTDYDIQPVLLNKQTQQLDYFENKKIYIVKKLNGVLSVAN